MTKRADKPEKLLDAPCPSCGADGAVYRLSRPETVEVRGCPVSVTRVFRRCEACGAEFENSRDPDWKPEAFAAFREKMGLLTPGGIKAWRKRVGLTQAEVSALLGWGEATLGRYETGSLQTAAQDQQIRALMAPSGLWEALKSRPGAMAEAKREAIIAAIRPDLLREQAGRMLDAIIGVPEADIFSGHRACSLERLAAFVTALAGAGEYKTKLNKLMFYADFVSFRECGRSISGLRYARADLGPVPDHYERIFAALEWAGAIRRIEVPVGDGYGERIAAARKPAARTFSPAEARVLDTVRRHFAKLSAKAIVAASHDEEAWTATPNGRAISYEFAGRLRAV